MARCSRCGEENPERAKFCLNCGQSLAGDAAAAEQRKTVTILFADVVNSTGRGESTDPESTRHMLSRYFEVMKVALERHGGTVEKFIGDAVMSVFGIPIVHEDDALRAVRAAHDLTRCARDAQRGAGHDRLAADQRAHRHQHRRGRHRRPGERPDASSPATR